MTNPITQVNVYTQTPPTPSTLQQSGAIISQGGTTKPANSLTLVTSLTSLTGILESAQALTALTSTGTVATATVAGGHGWTTGDTIQAVLTGQVPLGYSGTFSITITSSTQFTYPVASGLGSVTTLGSVVLADKADLLAAGTTFFAQGSGLSVYVLELGEGTVAEGVTALTAWIGNNPGLIYSYLVPQDWDGVSSYLTFLNNYNTTTSKTYFFTTTTTGTYTSYTGVMKCAFTLVESPAAPVTEYTVASPFYTTLNYTPSSTNQVTPLSFAYMYGCTAYPSANNGTVLTQLLAANVNYPGSGAEGGVSNVILRNGRTMDGNVFNYWYAVDWAQIQLDLAVTNAVITGSNNALAPLLYNQPGINTLQDVATQVLNNGVTYGLLNGAVKQTTLPAATFAANFAAGLYAGQNVINAEPFLTYTSENPSDYTIGKYAGLSAVIVPQLGFQQIIFNLTATTFV